MYRVRHGGSSAIKHASQIDASGASSGAHPSPTTQLILDRQSIMDFIVCPKKFYHMRALPILQPPTLLKPNPLRAAASSRPPSISQMVRLQDSFEFRELCYIWDRNTTTKNAVLVRESDFEQAHVRTTDIVNDYFETTHKKLGRGAPPLLLHRPAIRSLVPVGGASGSPSNSRFVELRSRPTVLHFYPKSHEWRFYHPSAVTDPLTDKFRAEWSMQSMLFDMCALMGWQGTTPLLSERSKEFLKEWSTSPSETPRSSTTTTTAVLRADKSAVLSIRPYISGPVTLQYHDTYTLSQFVQKTVLSEFSKRAVSSRSSSTTEEKPLEWDLNVGLASMNNFIREAAQILCGSVDERRRRLWSALSKNTASDDGSEESASFAHLVSSVCKKEVVNCPLFSAGNCLPLASPSAPNGVVHQEAPADGTVFEMPGINIDKKSALWASNVHTLRDVANSAVKHQQQAASGPALKLSLSQSRFLDARLGDHIFVNPTAVAKWFDSIKYPAFMLDFEAVQFALPPFEQSKPYQAIPFQFSLDVFHHDVLTETPTHYDFLFLEDPNCNPFADPRGSCVTNLMAAIRKEREIAKSRLSTSQPITDGNDLPEGSLAPPKKGKAKDILEGKMTKGLYSSDNRKMTVQPWEGTIIAHFASYERSVLQKASLLLPQFRDEIANMVFLDTIDLARAGLVHPAAKGSTSLKKLVPALLSKEEQYQAFHNVAGGNNNLDDSTDEQEESADGSSAAALFRLWRQKGAADLTLVKELQDAKVEAERAGWGKVRSQLLQYCNADTRNMYLVVRAIHKLVEASRARGDAYDKDGWSIPFARDSNSVSPAPRSSPKVPSRQKKAEGAPPSPAPPPATERKKRGRPKKTA